MIAVPHVQVGFDTADADGSRELAGVRHPVDRLATGGDHDNTVIISVVDSLAQRPAAEDAQYVDSQADRDDPAVIVVDGVANGIGDTLALLPVAQKDRIRGPVRHRRDAWRDAHERSGQIAAKHPADPRAVSWEPQIAQRIARCTAGPLVVDAPVDEQRAALAIGPVEDRIDGVAGIGTSDPYYRASQSRYRRFGPGAQFRALRAP